MTNRIQDLKAIKWSNIKKGVKNVTPRRLKKFIIGLMLVCLNTLYLRDIILKQPHTTFGIIWNIFAVTSLTIMMNWWLYDL